MTASIRDILAQIDRLDEAEQAELRDLLRLRAREQWEQLAEAERRRSIAEGITEADIDRAVDDIRYPKTSS